MGNRGSRVTCRDAERGEHTPQIGHIGLQTAMQKRRSGSLRSHVTAFRDGNDSTMEKRRNRELLEEKLERSGGVTHMIFQQLEQIEVVFVRKTLRILSNTSQPITYEGGNRGKERLCADSFDAEPQGSGNNDHKSSHQHPIKAQTRRLPEKKRRRWQRAAGSPGRTVRGSEVP